MKRKAPMKTILFLSLSITALVLAGCSTSTDGEESGYTLIDAEELAAMIDERGETFLLVNTHIPFEGNLPSTDLSVPFDEINQNLDQFPADKDAEIVLYCRSDRMSRIAAEELVEAGYTNLKMLTGGMVAWQNAGMSLEMEP
jgi:rhodanese-related sulfurtransferase